MYLNSNIICGSHRRGRYDKLLRRLSQNLYILVQLQNLEARGFVDYTIDRKIATDELISAFKKAFYSQWVDAVLHDSPVLLELMRVPHDEAVRRFKEKDELNFEINKAKIRASVSAYSG